MIPKGKGRFYVAVNKSLAELSTIKALPVILGQCKL
jgi:hypothetical protein